MTKRKRYTQEFKRQAVELLETRDRSGMDVARELGIRQSQLYKWREEMKRKGDTAFRGPGRRPVSQDDEVACLKRENARLKEELDILKKAAAYFAKELP